VLGPTRRFLVRGHQVAFLLGWFPLDAKVLNEPTLPAVVTRIMAWGLRSSSLLS
jgi:hypothetical protein